MKGCPNVTEKGVTALVRAMTKIRVRKMAFEAPKVLIREIVVLLEKKISRVRLVSQLDVPEGRLGDRAFELANIN